ncbi:4782_t:CDS:2 [Dentiscutata erythropus]|uniref:4782_t:CDS:1 n=1 Tax=Dentiscutata erythropus TaxID=1348616 RepID=A0A9N9EMT9_9GLOM|nr:4782_t:CDS:2 [Dentiscutata erythropus]
MSINIVNTSIEKLLLNLTKKQPGTDDYKKCVKYVHSTFKFGKFGGTNQKDVLKKYEGPTINVKKPDKPRLKASDIFHDEPLIGPHWAIKTDYNEDDDDDDWDFDVQD